MPHIAKHKDSFVFSPGIRHRFCRYHFDFCQDQKRPLLILTQSVFRKKQQSRRLQKSSFPKAYVFAQGCFCGRIRIRAAAFYFPMVPLDTAPYGFSLKTLYKYAFSYYNDMKEYFCPFRLYRRAAPMHSASVKLPPGSCRAAHSPAFPQHCKTANAI